MRLIVEKIPLFVIVAVVCTITYMVQSGALVYNADYPLSWRMANALISYVTYLQRYFWPVGLVACYPRLSLDLPTGEVLSSLAVLLGVTVVAVAYRRGLPYLAVGWFWYLGMLMPAIGLLQVGTVAVADRCTYLPQIGIGIALA